MLDLTRVLAGPYCTMVLSDLGARVIKVERPGHGDDARAIGPFIAERSAYFTSLNRGKQSIALDLKADSDRAVFEQLLERSLSDHRALLGRYDTDYLSVLRSNGR